VKIHEESREGRSRIRVEGRVNLETTPLLRTSLSSLVQRRAGRIVADLSGVEAMDSSGAAALVLALREARRAGRTFEIASPSEAVGRVLRLLQVDGLFGAGEDEGPTRIVSAPSRTKVIEAEGVARSFQGRTVLSDVSFTVRTGETLVIMGRSGSGKTTCLRILMGQVRPDHGRVALFGRDLAGLARRELAATRRRFGVVFQSGALLNSLSVKENVALPLRELTALDGDVISLMVKMRLEKVGLRDYADYLPDELSGGMKKRVGVARALIMDPEVLFYDEPTAGLDPVMTAVINQLIRDVARGLDVASVVVTHDMESAFKVADRMIMLFEGRVVAEGSPEEVRKSRDPVLRQFVDGNHDGPVSYTESSVRYSDDLLGP
jgi:phospholipid/cholesterol/gamma-HCH transport system ATP-binding protein